EITAVYGAVLEQLLRNALGQIAGDGKADTLESTSPTLDGRSDAHNFAVEADKRPAAVARVDRRVRLQKIVLVAGAVAQATALGADDAGRHRASQAEGSANCQHAVALFHLAAVAELQVRERSLRLDADNRQIGAWVAANVLAGEIAAVLQRD